MAAEETYSDSELIIALNTKDKLNSAILYIYQHYNESISSFIRAKGGSQQDAEDVMQEAVVSLIEVVQKNKFRGEASLKTFLVSIAKNIWFNQLKKRDRSANREKIYENSRDQQEADVSQHISTLETNQEMRKVMQKLDESCRKILTLFYYENLSMKEIVNYLPYDNEQVVRNKKYKCLQQLTGLLKNNLHLNGLIAEKFK